MCKLECGDVAFSTPFFFLPLLTINPQILDVLKLQILLSSICPQPPCLLTNCPFVLLSGAQGYVYSTFLKPYNPLRDSQRAAQMVKEQPQQQSPAALDEDFDDLSLFVSGSGSSSLRSFSLNTTDSSSTLSGLQGEQDSLQYPEDTLDNDTQQVCVRVCVSVSVYGCFVKLFMSH